MACFCLTLQLNLKPLEKIENRYSLALRIYLVEMDAFVPRIFQRGNFGCSVFEYKEFGYAAIAYRKELLIGFS
jgi:hypothetical protein